MIDARGSGVPGFLHWGADLGELDALSLLSLADSQTPAIAYSAPDIALRQSILPLLETGWQGRPALSGSWDAVTASTPFFLDHISDVAGDAATFRLSNGSLDLSIRYELTPEGLLAASATLTNRLVSVYRLAELAITLPVADAATEGLDFGGHWLAERIPQRWPLRQGSVLRESRHGRPGHDSSYLFAAGTAGFSFRSGELWAAHLGWSGNQRVWADHQASGMRLLGLGELLAPDEVRLAEGSSYSTPTVYASYSASGLDGVAERFHRYLRRTSRRPEGPRPVILNTWETTYFAHELGALTRLADTAAAVGVERFVLDDGWMSGRVDDSHGLGDWTVDATRWPDGLGPLLAHIVAAGMDFGLWVEPEMANPESVVLREHPDWVLGGALTEHAMTARHQVVVNLALPEVFDSVLTHLDSLLSEYPIAYLKWDHNRDLFTPAAHEQTLAVYRLMDELAARHPGVEIESCASGGARIDLGILSRVSRVWASDTNDPLERQRIYRWTGQLVPPEFLGVHLGAATSHTTGRTHSLAFRLATALFGWAGIEQDLTKADPQELKAIAKWVATYKELRPLINAGTVVRDDRDESATWVHGIVDSDQSNAVFAVVAMTMPMNAFAERLRLPGLDPTKTYDVSVLDLGADPFYIAAMLPAWMVGDGVRATGATLGSIGLPAPPLAPEQAVVLRIRAAS